MKYIILILLIALFVSCENQEYKPDHLRKLTDDELIEAAVHDRQFSQKHAVYKNQIGENISLDSIRKIKYPCFNHFVFDKYMNENNEVIEIIIRPATQHDLEVKAKISLAFFKQPEIEIVDIDCNKIGEILDTVHFLDQEMRKNGNGIDYDIEHQCLNKVISIIEKCGMPTLKEINEQQMTTIWLVFQHTHHNIRKEYFPLLLKSAKNGDLKMSHIALMLDRILMKEGKPQKYGSQVQAGCDSEWELYNLEKPEMVNQRRSEMGLGPLEDYLKEYGIVFNVKQIGSVE